MTETELLEIRVRGEGSRCWAVSRRRPTGEVTPEVTPAITPEVAGAMPRLEHCRLTSAGPAWQQPGNWSRR